MSKRFTESMKWNDPWFRKLESKNKFFWIYLCDQCDFSGVWQTDFEMASLLMGTQVDESAIEYFNKGKERIKIMTDGSWQIIDFIIYQYGSMSGNDPFHKSLRKLFEKHTRKGAIMPPLEGATKPTKDKDKDKDKDKKKGGVGENKSAFCKEKNVFLTQFQFAKLQDLLGGYDNTMVQLEKLSIYMLSKGVKYKSHYHTILNWDRMSSENNNHHIEPAKERKPIVYPDLY